MTSNANPVFSTRDLPLAATLSTLGFSVVGVDFQIEGTRNMPVGYFKFEETKELLDAEKKFNQGHIAIEPRVFLFNMRNLKARVTDGYQNPNRR